MSERWWTFLVAAVIFAAAATPAVLIQNEQIYRFKVAQVQYRDALYLPNSEYVKAVTCGYDQFAAHFLWLRMIQSFAAGWTRPENVQQMMQYFEVITDLDPHFLEAYRLAMMAVSEKVKRPELVAHIIEKAYIQNPGIYSLPYMGAYNAFWEQDKPSLAKYYVRLALHDPNAPDHVRRWLPFFDMKEGRYRAAYEYSLRNYLGVVGPINKSSGAASQTVDTEAQNMYRLNLLRAADGWITSVIEPEVRKYYEAHKQWPTVEQLDEAGLFRNLELPDFGLVFKITEEIRNGQRDKLSAQDTEYLMEHSVKKWPKLPPCPYSFLKPHYEGWVVWPDSTLLRTSSSAIDPKFKFQLIVARGEAMNELKRICKFINDEAAAYKATHGGKYPASFKDFAEQFDIQRDPFGGKYTYDPKTGTAACTTYPNIRDMQDTLILW